MKPLAVGILTILAISSLASAQDPPRVEIFGGYSAERIAPCGTQTTAGQGISCGLEQGELQSSLKFYNGWNAAVTWGSEPAPHRFVGFTADFSGHYGFFGSQSSLYSFLFGPTVAFRLSKLTPFGHALVGLTKETTSSSASSSANPSQYSFAAPKIALGGGLDLNVSRRFAVRLGQADYEWQRNPTSGLPGPRGFRFSAGVVFKF
jgi:hypothetical protein